MNIHQVNSDLKEIGRMIKKGRYNFPDLTNPIKNIKLNNVEVTIKVIQPLLLAPLPPMPMPPTHFESQMPQKSYNDFDPTMPKPMPRTPITSMSTSCTSGTGTYTPLPPTPPSYEICSNGSSVQEIELPEEGEINSSDQENNRINSPIFDSFGHKNIKNYEKFTDYCRFIRHGIKCNKSNPHSHYNRHGDVVVKFSPDLAEVDLSLDDIIAQKRIFTKARKATRRASISSSSFTSVDSVGMGVNLSSGMKKRISVMRMPRKSVSRRSRKRTRDEDSD